MTLASAVILGTVTALASGLLAAEIRRASAEARADAVRRDAVAVLVELHRTTVQAQTELRSSTATLPSYWTTGAGSEPLQTVGLRLHAIEQTAASAVQILER